MGDISSAVPFRIGMHLAVWDAEARCEALWDGLEVSGVTIHRVRSSSALDRLEPWQVHAICVVVAEAMDGPARVSALRERAYCGPLVAMAPRERAKELLAAGADDCVRDDIDPSELTERVQTIARRTGPYVVGPLVVEPVTLRAWIRGRELMTRRSDITLLAHLACSVGRPVSIQELGRHVFDEPNIERNRIDVTVWRVRKALDRDAWVLETVPSAGFRLRQRRDDP